MTLETTQSLYVVRIKPKHQNENNQNGFFLCMWIGFKQNNGSFKLAIKFQWKIINYLQACKV